MASGEEAAAGRAPEVEADDSSLDTPLDTLDNLEDRIRRAADVVATLRSQRDSALAELKATRQTAAPAIEEAKKLRVEVESLRAERAQVRKRIEKLLGQMDTLSGS
jgi:uncharacterized coiled-coil DUF342 family protein